LYVLEKDCLPVNEDKADTPDFISRA
jgi:hypothetical protein